MNLRHEPDVSVADWYVRSDAAWTTLATLGPPGHEANARVHLDLDEDGRTDHEVFADLMTVAARHTRTPERAWFGLWDGWGDIDGGSSAGMLSAMGHHSSWFPRLFTAPKPPPTTAAFSPDILDAPRLLLGDDGDRSYLLFSGPLTAWGRWGARPIAPDWPARTISEPNLVWPDDRAWFVANDVDPDWIGVGGPEALVAELVRHPALLVERVPYVTHPPGRGAP